MPLKGQAGVVRAHPAPVVYHLNQELTAAFDDDIDLVGLRVQGVFHQLLDHRGRTVYHLAGRDLVGNMLG